VVEDHVIREQGMDFTNDPFDASAPPAQRDVICDEMRAVLLVSVREELAQLGLPHDHPALNPPAAVPVPF
jgi:hypothetical protein